MRIGSQLAFDARDDAAIVTTILSQLSSFKLKSEAAQAA